MNRQAKAALLVTVLALFWSPGAWAQGGGCEDGSDGSPWIGVHAFHCPGGTCDVSKMYYVGSVSESGAAIRTLEVPADAEGTVAAWYEFSTEPWLRGIDSGGPGAGILEEGDVLVAVNGYLITSSRGGRELSTLPTDQDATLTLRRNDRLVEVSLQPTRRCDMPMSLSGNTKLKFLYDGGAYTELPVGREGAFGASFECDGCSFSLSTTGELSWDNPQELEIATVELGGPADLAGLQPGDTLLEINGAGLDTDLGARLLLNPDAGTVLDLYFERDGELIEAELVTSPTVGLIDPREQFVVYREKAWGAALADFFTGWASGGSIELKPEFAMVMSGDSWAPSVYGAVFSWCDECSWTAAPNFGWEMSEYPTVESVTDGGAADDAGLRVGDVLTHVDGKDLKTEAGGLAFINLRTDEEVEIRFVRDGREQRATLVAGEVMDD